ncbi:2-oxoglutarate dehydrogenase E1 component [bacterium F16]|nr:2-oxoglutarate dehydrogenase E1 component [bacterium F16]
MDCSFIENADPHYIETLYQQYLDDPGQLDAAWVHFFQGFQFANENQRPLSDAEYGSDKTVSVLKLINAYRARGHLIAQTNPIRPRRLHHANLNLEYFGLDESDLETEFDVGREIRLGRATLRNIIAHLELTYCSSIGAEYRYISLSSIRTWLHERMEGIGNLPDYEPEVRTRIFTKLAQSVLFEQFLHIKYVGQKRFSLEGLEAFIPALDALFEEGGSLGVDEFVMGMAHRGRLNVLTNLFQKKFEALFNEFEGGQLPEGVAGDGDVKYHLGQSAEVTTSSGHPLHLSLVCNPSHLEAVAPVVLGNCRAKWERIYKRDHKKIVPILVHGDAAIAGQGVVYEIANFTELDGYQTGGVIHIVLNNQVGFTANYRETRSSLYCTDIAKVMASPVFHVNADDPEAVVHVCQMAIQLRQKFHTDVYIDILGYRRHGHNEGDEPRFTQPLLYDAISKHRTVLDIYAERLAEEHVLTKPESDKICNDFKAQLQKDLAHAREDKDHSLDVDFLGRQWEGFRMSKEADFEGSPRTGVSRDMLETVVRALTKVPNTVSTFPKIKKIIEQRNTIFHDEGLVDWGLAEALAFGTLLAEGHPVRLSGQDCRRGTFAHRHSVLIDNTDESEYVFLNHIQSNQELFQVYNSHLSEYGVLGYEFGYSLAMPNGLTIWEAQFGDFCNGAQIIFDQFISSSESKWQRMSGITCFLPHGYEGQGPEHTSARLERFLSLAAEKNMAICYPTTPANFFHLLRRQMNVPYRVPLIVMTPKSLLRHPRVRSTVDRLENDCFQEIIDDPAVETAKNVDRLLLCAGKIYYELLERKETGGLDNVSIVRIEQFYPNPRKRALEIAEKYKTVEQWFWVQEEPENMGGWYFINARMHKLGRDIQVIARKKSASPAQGSMKKEKAFQQSVIDRAFDGLPKRRRKRNA